MLRKLLLGSIAGIATAVPVAGLAQTADGTTAGLSASEAEAAQTEQHVLGRIGPSFVRQDAQAASAGVGLRNRESGAINLSGLSPDPDVIRGFLYWNIIVNGDPPAGAEEMTLQRVGNGAGNPVTLTGEIVGTGDTPCWGGTQNVVYRAVIPRPVIDGNGTYMVTVPDEVSSLKSGASPWDNHSLPAYNGASMVVVESGQGSVLVYDEGMAGTMFMESLVYALGIPPAFRSGFTTFMHSINSDGQTGTNANFPDSTGLTRYTTRVNGNVVSGHLSDGAASDFNGATGGRVAQLWDNAIRNISSALPADSNRARVAVRNNGGTDCLVKVADVLDRR